VRWVRLQLSKQVRAPLDDLGNAAAEQRDAALLALRVATVCRRSELSGLD
jgi:hypothetical protein